MWSLVLKRLAGGFLTLFVIASLCFFIVRFAPGNPFSAERQIPAEVMRNLERKHNRDKPLVVQYLLRMKGYFTGDLDTSIRYEGKDVSEIIFPSFATSLQLGSLAFVMAMLLGVPIGIIAAVRQNRLPDSLSMSLALVGICVPNFLLGPLLVMIFSLALGWLPAAGWPDSASPWELSKLILPAFTLSLVFVAYVSRLTRAGMLDVLRRDYIRTARAKGLDEKKVLLKHALKNGVTPVVSFSGPMAAAILTGSVVVEKIFFIPGMGQHFIDGALARDDTLVMGTLLIYSALIIFFNLVVDLAYGWLDPRVRSA